MIVEDEKKKPTIMTFDLVDDESPLILGLNVKRYDDMLNRGEPPVIPFKIPTDSRERSLFTYIAQE